MDRIWANRLIAGTRLWNDVPPNRRETVRAILRARVAAGVLTQEQFDTISGTASTDEPDQPS